MDIYQLVLLCTVALVALLIIVKSPIYNNSLQKKREKLSNEYIHDLEDEVNFQKKKARGLQLRQNTKEAGVSVSNPDGGFEAIVPEIIKGISPFIPEKLRPLFEDKEISGSIINEVLKNPKQYTGMIKNMMSKVNPNGNKEASNSSELSV